MATKVSDRSSSYILISVAVKPKNQIQIKTYNFLRGYHYFGKSRFLQLHLKVLQVVIGIGIKTDSHIACRAHAVPLIHTCYAAPLPSPDSAVSFVKVRVVAGNIRTASPTI